MKNIAKCTKCNDIIESFHPQDYVICTCQSIAVFGGEAMKSWASDYGLFRRIDGSGREIPVEYRESIVSETKGIVSDCVENVQNIQHLMDSLHHMAGEIERLPDQAMREYVTQYDLYRVVSLLSDIFKSI